MSRRPSSHETDLKIEALFEDSRFNEELGVIHASTGRGWHGINHALYEIRDYVGDDFDAKSLEVFWNFNRAKIEGLFTYNPVELRPKLISPDEDRINGKPFSVLLASLIKPDSNLTLLGRINEDDMSPLVDNLAAYIPTGTIHIVGETGDGIAHHAGKEAKVFLGSATSENLGFGSHEEAKIHANGSVGKNFADNVSGGVPSLTRLHR